MHHQLINLTSVGTLTAATNKAMAVSPCAGKIVNIFSTCSDVGTGSTKTIADVHLNGTTIFSQSTKITISTVSTTVSYSTLSSQPTNVAAGDIFTLDIDSVGTAMVNLGVRICITRSGVQEESNVADLDTVF
jgi:hypothetical protein